MPARSKRTSGCSGTAVEAGWAGPLIARVNSFLLQAETCNSGPITVDNADFNQEQPLIRPTQREDATAIMRIVEESGQFDAGGLDFVRDTLEQHLTDSSTALWLTADDGEPVGVAYCAPEAVASGTWNLLMLWTRSDRHGKGVGSQLVTHIEAELRGRAARLLIVETSGLPAFNAARSFYKKVGFSHEATIKNFFAAGDDKLVFTKPLAPSAA